MHNRLAAASPPRSQLAATEWTAGCDTRTFPAVQLPITDSSSLQLPYRTVLQVVSMGEVPAAMLSRTDAAATASRERTR